MATDDDLREKLWELCKRQQAAWAKEHGYERVYINQVCNGKKPMTKEIAELLGYRLKDDKWEPDN